jgi:hypothetical protein
MLLAPTLSLNTPARGYDADATAFAAASGATDVAALSAFVKGVKELGLWNSMVCWPLRSSQNAGTGTTAYSLGGLGTFNGTLANGPTWGSDGITTDGVDDLVSMTIPAAAAWTGIAIMRRLNNSDSEPRYYWGLIYSPAPFNEVLSGATYYLKDGGLGIFQSENSINNWSPARPAANATTNMGFQSVAYSESGPSASVSLNGTFTAQSSVRNLSTRRPDILRIGARADGAGDSNAEHAFYGYITAQLENSTVEQLRSLYKTTLGTGITSLP